jgi:hypothetical protein
MRNKTMRTPRLRATITAAVLSLLLPAIGWSQQIRIIDCQGIASYQPYLEGCQGQFNPSLLPFAQNLAVKALAFEPRLPEGLFIDVQFDQSFHFSQENRPGQADLITLGEGMIIDMWNSYADVWDMYDYDGDAYDANSDFKAFSEWALFHEIGHSLIEFSGYQHGKKDHEDLADDFATISMIRLYPEESQHGGTPAEQAAQGLYYLALPPTARQARSGGKRNAFESSAPQEIPQPRRRSLDGDEGAHQPNPDRAWEIACLVHGSGLAPHPINYQENPYDDDDGSDGCLESDYFDALSIMMEYAPSLEYSN